MGDATVITDAERNVLEAVREWHFASCEVELATEAWRRSRRKPKAAWDRVRAAERADQERLDAMVAAMFDAWGRTP